MSTWTQLQAYHSILPEIPKRRRQVLEALMDHNGFTGMELSHAMGQDARNVTPRLNELRKMYNAIHKGNCRQCRVTGHPAETWWCGPPHEGTLHLPTPQDDKLLQRVSLLIREAPHLGKNGAGPMIAQILGVSTKRLQQAISKEKKRRDKAKV